jgi:four helix bundle protein
LYSCPLNFELYLFLLHFEFSNSLHGGGNMKSENREFKLEFKKRLYKFVLEIVTLLDALQRDNVSRRLGDQLLRSSTSIIANFVEGQSGSSKKDFVKYMEISLKSANESKLWLSLLKDTNRAPVDKVEFLLRELSEIANIFGSIVLTAKGKRHI